MRKIASPVRAVIKGIEQGLTFGDGREFVECSFEKNYRVEKLRAEGDRIVIELAENSPTPTNWAGEKQTSFF